MLYVITFYYLAWTKMLLSFFTYRVEKAVLYGGSTGCRDHVYFVHPSTDISVDLSTDVLVDIPARGRPICQPTYRSSVGQYVDRDVSLDISADISVEHRSICRLTLDRYVGRYVDREWSSDCRPTCRSIGYRHSADTSLLLAYW